MSESITDIIYWWENELKGDSRRELMGDYQWQGTTEERHLKLREFREKYLKRNGQP